MAYNIVVGAIFRWAFFTSNVPNTDNDRSRRWRCQNLRTKAIHSQGKLRQEHRARKEQKHIVEGVTRTTAFLLRACVSQALYQCAIFAGSLQTAAAAHTDISTHRIRSLHSFFGPSWRRRVGEDELEKTSWRRRVGEDELEKTTPVSSGSPHHSQANWCHVCDSDQTPARFTGESPTSNHPPQKYSSFPARVHSFPNFGGFSYAILPGN